MKRQIRVETKEPFVLIDAVQVLLDDADNQKHGQLPYIYQKIDGKLQKGLPHGYKSK